MISDSELEARKRLAIEMILESESLTDDLQDDEAGILLDWGLTQAEAYALATQEITDEEETRLALDQGVTTVRRAMRFINDLVAERMGLSDGEMLKELLDLTSLARELPRVQAIAGQEEEEEILEDID
jgi:signal transduction histidine kinase